MVSVSKQKKISAIIQARMGSERLPGKVLLPILGKSVLWHIIERLKFSKLINQIILAIPNTKENDILEKFALENSIFHYRGSEKEVLERVYLAARANGCDIIVEVPADKPLIDPEIIDLTIKEHTDSKVDYTDTSYPSRLLPLGLDIAVFNFQALEKAYKSAKDPYNRENVTSYFYENPSIFKINKIKLPKYFQNPNLRLTLDTKEDLELITKIYENLHRKGEFFKTREVLRLINQRPELREINKHIVQRKRI